MSRQRAWRKRRSGCGMLVLAVVVTCLLLVVNRVLSRAIYGVLIPLHLDFERLRAILQFLLMIGLLFPQWWLIDRVALWVRGARAPSGDG